VDLGVGGSSPPPGTKPPSGKLKIGKLKIEMPPPSGFFFDVQFSVFSFSRDERTSFNG
jgi:hypothetical protein